MPACAGLRFHSLIISMSSRTSAMRSFRAWCGSACVRRIDWACALQCTLQARGARKPRYSEAIAGAGAAVDQVPDGTSGWAAPLSCWRCASGRPDIDCKGRDDRTAFHHPNTVKNGWDDVEGGHEQGKMPMSFKAVRCLRNAGAHPAALAPPRRTSSHSAARSLLAAGACIAATLLLVVPLLTLEADARGGGGHGGGGGGGGHGGGGHGAGIGGHSGGHGGFAARGGGGARSFGAAHIGARHVGAAHIGASHVGAARISARHIGAARIGTAHVGGARIATRSVAGSRVAGRSSTPHAATARLTGSRSATALARNAAAGARARDPAPRVFGNRAIANAAWQSRFASSRFHGRFFGSAWPWWWGGLVTGWFGPLFWPYAYYDFSDYVFLPYAYDDFWPFAFDDVYYGIYGPYAYGGSSNGYYSGRSAQPGMSSARYAARTNPSERRAAEVCSDDAAQLTTWPLEP